MSVEFYRESPGKFDSRTLKRTTLSRWTGRTLGASYAREREHEKSSSAYPQSAPRHIHTYIGICIYIYIYIYVYMYTAPLNRSRQLL